MASDAILYGKYQLTELLARGGMGEVWKARSHGVEGFEKTLVIKRILPELSKNTRFVEMFIDEAKTAVTLTHANIVQVFDLGFVEGTYFMAMEYVPGFDLATILAWGRERGRPLPPELAVYVVSELAKALDYAHRRRDAELRPLGIVHRDVSPENVLVSFEGEVKLTDFGIARSRSGVAQLATLPPGKFAYLSPEQANGQDGDARVDLFALGALLYEALTGKRPLSGDSPESSLERARRGAFPTREALEPEIGPELAAIVARATARDPDARYPNAGELYEDLIQVLYASGRRIGALDLARFVEELSALQPPSDEEQLAPISGLEEIFSEQTRTGVSSGRGVTPVQVPTRSNSSVPSPPSSIAPRSEWREVTALAIDGLPRSDAMSFAARYGGTAFPGNALSEPTLVLFGLQEADGRDAQAAARCALRVLRSYPDLEPRALVHAGRVLLDAEGRLRHGQPLETLRLETRKWLARVGQAQAAASPAAAKLLRGRFELAPAQGDGPRRIERERLADEGIGKFVGRRQELRMLGEALAQANRGRMGVVGIRGEAGAGKSRLLTETARRLAQAGHDVGIYVATCSPEGKALPFHAIQELLRAVLGIEEMEPEARVREKVDRLRLLGMSTPQRDAVGRVLGLGLHSSSTTSTVTLRAALLRMAYKLAQDRLTVFAWDGAESMDEPSRELLATMLRNPINARVVALFTYRPTDTRPWSTAPVFTEITLRPLTQEDVARLSRHRLVAAEVPDELVRELAQRSGGNPLYLEELLSAMRESGALEVHDGVVQLKRREGAEAELPGTLRGLVASRVGKLSASHKIILQLAVTFGSRFVPELLARAAGQDEAAVRQALALLEARDIVRGVGPSEYMFAHDLVRELLYDSIPQEERPALHAAAARAIETLRPAEVDALVDKLAHHHREAGHREQAISFLLRAAERLEREQSLDAAVDAYLEAIDLTCQGAEPFVRTRPSTRPPPPLRGPSEPPRAGRTPRGLVIHPAGERRMSHAERVQLLALYARVGELAYRTRAAELVADRLGPALELAEAVGSDDYVARLSMLRGRLLHRASRVEEGRAWLERAHAVARRRGDIALERDVALAAAEAHARNGEYKGVLRFATEALEFARATGDSSVQVRCLLLLAPARAAAGEADAAQAALDEVVQLTRGGSDGLLEVERERVRALVLYEKGDQEGCVDAARRAFELAKEYGYTYEAGVAAHLLGEFYLRADEDKRAFAALRSSHDIASENGYTRLRWLNVCLLGFLDVQRFGALRGLERMREALRYAQEHGHVWDFMNGQYLLAMAEQRLGSLAAARASLEEVRELADRHGHVRLLRDAERALEALDKDLPIALPS